MLLSTKSAALVTTLATAAMMPSRIFGQDEEVPMEDRLTTEIDEKLPSDGVSEVWEFLSAGGVFMFLIFLCSVVAVTVIVYKALVMRTQRIVPTGIEQILGASGQYVANGDLEQLHSNLRASDTALSRTAGHALSGEFATEEAASSAAESEAREEIVKLQGGMAVLEVVITIAPLLGLLGTVSGLVSVFSVLADAGADDADPALLARGIALALTTTIAGLAVAVPTVIAHTYFGRKIEKIAARMEVVLGRGIGNFYREWRNQQLIAQGAVEG